MRHFTDAELEGLLGLEEVVEVMRRAFLAFDEDGAPVQPRIPIDAGALRLNTMSAAIPDLGYCGAKVYTSFQSRFSFVILLFSMQDGRVLASFDAGSLTRLRTAAVSVLAAERLARKESATLVLFGTGIQATGHAVAFARQFPITTIHVVGRSGVDQFVERLRREAGVRVVASRAEEAVPLADILVTATRSSAPLFKGQLVPQGCTIIAVGSSRPQAAELDSIAVSRCENIVVEAVEAARHEAGDLLLAEMAGVDPWHKINELGAVLAGKAPSRRTDAEIVLFESLGWALEDVAIASLAYERLRERRAFETRA